MHRIHLAAPLLLLLALPLREAAAVQARAGGCDARTFHEMYRCAVDRYRASEAERDRAYRETLARLPAHPRGKLQAAERAWARYREAHCDYEAAKSAGRREYQVVRHRCLAELTEARTAALRATPLLSALP